MVGEYPNSPGFFGAGLAGAVDVAFCTLTAGRLPKIDIPVFLIVPEPDGAPDRLKIEELTPVLDGLPAGRPKREEAPPEAKILAVGAFCDPVCNAG